jgi:hypothetical protein
VLATARQSSELHAALAAVPGTQVGGTSAQGRDFIDAAYGNAPYILAFIMLVTSPPCSSSERSDPCCWRSRPSHGPSSASPLHSAC